METITNCPRNGDKCSLCVTLAAEEFFDELRGGGIDEDTTRNYLGDAKLQGPVEEQGGISALGCEARRNRARIIGRKAGEALVDRTKAPGDV